jgi:hypothetical protein
MELTKHRYVLLDINEDELVALVPGNCPECGSMSLRVEACP